MKDFAYAHARAKAEHFRALGIHELWIKEDNFSDPTYPWSLVVDVEPGGTHRLDMVVTFKFTARDPEVKMDFSWFYDIEEHGSNAYRINTASLRAVMKALSPEGREKFRKLLLSIVEKVRTRANEFSKEAEKLMADAATLSDIACG